MNYFARIYRFSIHMVLSSISLWGGLITPVLSSIVIVGNLNEPAIATLQSNNSQPQITEKDLLIMILSEQNPKKKLEGLDQLIIKFPKFADAYYQRGSLRSDIGDISGSQEDYDFAAKYYLVSIRSRENNFSTSNSEAISVINKVIKFSPNNICAYYYRAVIYENNSNIRAAIKDSTRILNLTENGMRKYLSDAYEIRGGLYAKVNNYQNSIEDYENSELAIKRGEFSFEKIERFCYIYTAGASVGSTGNVPTEREAQHRLANIYYKRGQIKIKKDKIGAVQDLNRALVIFVNLNDETSKQKVKATINSLK